MLNQLRTIAWAQLRITRNHLPRSTFGSLLGIAISVIWYGGFAVLAAFLAASLPDAPLAGLRQWLGLVLLCVFLFWQIAPLLTLTGGWSLDLKRLQAYPLSKDVLLASELVLRITAAGEMVLVLLGGAVGLALNPATPPFAPLAVLLYIPFNLLVSLTIRDVISTAFQTRSYVREILAVVLVSIGVIPQLFVRYYMPRQGSARLLKSLDGVATPWHAISALATNDHALKALTVATVWMAVAFAVARWQFARALKTEETLTAPARGRGSRVTSFAVTLRTRFSSLFADPVGALVEKELRALVRMPRFRVVFLLATVFSVVVFLPMQLRLQNAGAFLSHLTLQLMVVYGSLILSDVLLWNMFGFDRSAAQVYFVTPVSFVSVIRAKNMVAALFLSIQTFITLAAAFCFRLSLTPMTIVTAVAGAAVTGLLFMCIGNFSSVANPRAADPKATLRKQNTGIIQLWMVGAFFCAAALLGAAYLAGWAEDSPWATLAALGLEITIGAIAYRFSVESAVARVSRDREPFLAALDKSSSPVSS